MNELNKKLTKISNNKNLKTLAINDIKVDEVNDVLIIKFMDGDVQKAVRDCGDSRDFDTAILVCICKHLMSGQSSMYNAIKYIRQTPNIFVGTFKKININTLSHNTAIYKKRKGCRVPFFLSVSFLRPCHKTNHIQ